MPKIIGIDLGTSNSAAAVMEAGKPVIIPSAEGQTMAGKAFPSYVAFTKDNQLLVGEPARRQVVTNTEGTAFEFKRKMGTDYKYKLNGKEYAPEQLSAFLLQKIKKDAEARRLAAVDCSVRAPYKVIEIIHQPAVAHLFASDCQISRRAAIESAELAHLIAR